MKSEPKSVGFSHIHQSKFTHTQAHRDLASQAWDKLHQVWPIRNEVSRGVLIYSKSNFGVGKGAAGTSQSDIDIRAARPILSLLACPVLIRVNVNRVACLWILLLAKPPWLVLTHYIHTTH